MRVLLVLGAIVGSYALIQTCVIVFEAIDNLLVEYANVAWAVTRLTNAKSVIGIISLIILIGLNLYAWTTDDIYYV